MRKITKRSAVFLTAAVVAVGGAGAAWAWSLTGEGNTTAKAASVVSLSITGVQVDGLAPGAPSAISFTVSNSNKFPVKLTAVHLSGGAAASVACPASNITLVAEPAIGGIGDPGIGAAGTSPNQKTFVVPAAISMASDAPDACQGAVIGVHVKLDASTI